MVKRGVQMSNLPADLLRIIFSKLSLIDQIRCRTVCKSWKELMKSIRPADKLPWVMLYHWSSPSRGRVKSVCKLYVPSDRKMYTVEDTCMGEERKNFVGSKIYDSKNGWVLFCKKIGQVPQKTSILFAYSPFTNEVINFPILNSRCEKAAFSSSPTSSDCVLFASNKAGRLISIYRHGDQNWKTLEFNCVKGSITDVAFLNGNIYFLFCGPTLGVFNVVKEEMHILGRAYKGEEDIGRNMEMDYGRNGGDYYLMESDGQLLNLGLYPLHGAEYCRRKWHICRFDFSTKEWVAERSLGQRGAFLESRLFFSFAIPALGEASEVEDTVNELSYPHQCMSTFSFKTDTFVSPCQPYSRIPTTKGLEAIWIQPPQSSF